MLNDWIRIEHAENLEQHFKRIESPRFSKKEKIISEEFDFVKSKFEKYSKILSIRLNKINDTSFSNFFWKKTLSIEFIRTISFLYESFIRYESGFNYEIHTYKFLSRESYYTPNTFEDLRSFLSKNELSNEQTFSIYLNSFFNPDKKSEIKIPINNNLTKINFDTWLNNQKHKIFLLKKKFEKKNYSVNTAFTCYFQNKILINLRKK